MPPLVIDSNTGWRKIWISKAATCNPNPASQCPGNATPPYGRTAIRTKVESDLHPLITGCPSELLGFAFYSDVFDGEPSPNMDGRSCATLAKLTTAHYDWIGLACAGDFHLATMALSDSGHVSTFPICPFLLYQLRGELKAWKEVFVKATVCSWPLSDETHSESKASE